MILLLSHKNIIAVLAAFSIVSGALAATPASELPEPIPAPRGYTWNVSAGKTVPDSIDLYSISELLQKQLSPDRKVRFSSKFYELQSKSDDSGTIQTTPFQKFALKTNLLYDAALMPNLEIECMFNHRWSMLVEGNVAWWKNDPKHKYYQIMMISPEVRRWFFTKDYWHGMYVGIFAGGGMYDLENGGTGYRGEGGMVGLSVGYMWPITRYLSLEAGLGAGYMFTRYKEYVPHDGHYLYLRTKDLNYFGPLKAKLSIAWRFNDINKSKKVKEHYENK